MRLTIGQKLFLGFAVPLSLLVLVGIIAVGQVQAMRGQTDELTRRTTLHQRMRDAQLQVLAQRMDALNFLLTADQRHLDALQEAAAKMRADLAFVNVNLEKQGDLRTVFEAVRSAVAQLTAQDAALIAFGMRDRLSVVNAFAGGSGRDVPRARALVKASEQQSALAGNSIEKILVDLRARANDAQITSERVARIGLLAVTIFVALAVATGTLVALILGKSISGRLRRVSDSIAGIVDQDFGALGDAMRALARGDLTQRLALESREISERGSDELAVLASSYNRLALGLRQVSTEFDEAASRLEGVIVGVASASEELQAAGVLTANATSAGKNAMSQIARASDGVAEGARDQALRIQTAYVTIEELSRAASQIATGAREQALSVQQAVEGVTNLDAEIERLASLGETLAAAAGVASGQAASGGDAVHATAEGMKKLRANLSAVESTMRTLEDRSQAVTEIVTVIDGIADQTNLLALNAAIEAARAGAHGRGFAVVADEIRKLAERAATSTREINAILSAIRKDTLEASKAMETAGAAMESGLTVAHRASEAFTTVNDAIAKTAGVAIEVAQKAEAMQHTSHALSDNMASVLAIVDQNLASSSQMRSTTLSIAETFEPIAASSQEQAAAANQVSASTLELTSQVERIDESAETVRVRADALAEMVSIFSVERELPAAETKVALPR